MDWINALKVGDEIIIRRDDGFLEEFIATVADLTDDGRVVAVSAVFTDGVATCPGVTYKFVKPIIEKLAWIKEHQGMSKRTLKEECLTILKDFKNGNGGVMSWDWDEDYYDTRMFDREDRILWTQQRLQKIIEVVEKEM